MARKFSKTELITIAKEIHTQLKVKVTKKRKKVHEEHEEKFKQSEECQKYLQCLELCGLTLDSKEYVKDRLHAYFYIMFEKIEPRENLPFNPQNMESILHELCLEQIKQGEDFDLDELINKYTEKYA